MPEILDSNYPGVQGKSFYWYHEQKFWIIFAFSGEHWTGLSIEKYEEISVFGVFNKNINFSTEFQYRVSLKKQ